jgi:hypothetical protein
MIILPLNNDYEVIVFYPYAFSEHKTMDQVQGHFNLFELYVDTVTVLPQAKVDVY